MFVQLLAAFFDRPIESRQLMSPDQSRGSPPDARRLWRHERLWPVVYSFLKTLLIAAMLWVNALDVRNGSIRLFYGIMAAWLIVTFFLSCFRVWRIEQVVRGLPLIRSRLDRSLRVLEFCLSAGMLLCALEAGARALPPLSNSSIYYPGVHFVWPDGFRPRNSYLLNDHPPGLKVGSPRILVLGDSYVEGAGVSRNERFCSQLSVSLRQSLPATQIIAGGSGGWNTQLEERFLARFGDDLNPDIVIVAYVLNDAEGDAGDAGVARKPNRWEMWLQSRLNSYLSYRLFRWRSGDLSAFWKTVQQQHQADSRNWLAVAASLKRIKAWCQRRKIPCQMVVLPIFSKDADTGREVMQQVTERTQLLGFHSYQMLDDFDERWLEFAVSPYDAHPNAAAHVRIANRIEAELKASQALTAGK